MVVCEAYYAQFNTDELQEAYDRVSPKVEENLEKRAGFIIVVPVSKPLPGCLRPGSGRTGS